MRGSERSTKLLQKLTPPATEDRSATVPHRWTVPVHLPLHQREQKPAEAGTGTHLLWLKQRGQGRSRRKGREDGTGTPPGDWAGQAHHPGGHALHLLKPPPPALHAALHLSSIRNRPLDPGEHHHLQPGQIGTERGRGTEGGTGKGNGSSGGAGLGPGVQEGTAGPDLEVQDGEVPLAGSAALLLHSVGGGAVAPCPEREQENGNKIESGRERWKKRDKGKRSICLLKLSPSLAGPLHPPLPPVPPLLLRPLLLHSGREKTQKPQQREAGGTSEKTRREKATPLLCSDLPETLLVLHPQVEEAPSQTPGAQRQLPGGLQLAANQKPGSRHAVRAGSSRLCPPLNRQTNRSQVRAL